MFFTSRGVQTVHRAKQRHTAGVSHQLPAWPGTTITSSSCSSSVTAVSRHRGWWTGSGPYRVCIFYRHRNRNAAEGLLCTPPSHSARIYVFFYLMHGNNLNYNVEIRHILCGGDRAEVVCVRAGHVSRSGRISPPDLLGRRALQPT